MTYPIVILADNKDISKDAFDRALKLRARVARTVELREDYVAKRGLDPAFCLPDGNWGNDCK